MRKASSRVRQPDDASAGSAPVVGDDAPEPTPASGRAFGPAGGGPSAGDEQTAAAVRAVIFDHISDAIFATDPSNRVTFWGGSAERMFGYPASEAVGQLFGELLPFRMAGPDDEHRLFAELAAGRTWRGKGTVRRRDGSEIWLESTVQPIMAEGRLVGSVSVGRDITATVEAQARLAEQEQFVNAIFDVVGALVVVLDPTGRVVRFNGACERLTGYAAAEVVGRPLWDVVIPAAEVDELCRVVADLASGRWPSAHEDHWLTRDGDVRTIGWESTCLVDGDGVVTHVIATGIDVTETRRGDEALHGVETVGRLLAEQGPTPAALEAVLAELETRLGYRFLSLYVRDGDGLRLGAQRGYATVLQRLDADSGVIGRVFRTAQATLVGDVGADPDYVPGDGAVVAEIAVPLVGDGQTLGVLNIESDRSSGLLPRDLRLARAIGDRLASALLRNQEQQVLRDRMRLFAALTTFAGVANAILDPQVLATALADAVGGVVPTDTIVITTLDRSDEKYRVRAVRGLDEAAVGRVIQPGDGNTGRAILDRTIVTSDHHPRTAYASALRAYVRYDALNGIAVPLVHEDLVLGVISLGRAGSGATFSDAEQEVISLLGSQAALALSNAYLVEEVSALAIHDGLTGLYNRRHFDAALDLAIARCRRRGPGAQLAAVMFDLDHFGKFNRLHGHLVGDAVLRLFAGILRERVRSADLVARYGGEEFIVILEDASLNDAVRVAETVRSQLESRPIAGPGGRPLHATVSAGCAAADPAAPNRDDLIARADVGLFMAKRAGRNRVVAA